MNEKIDMRIAIYSRKSKFSDKGDSVGNQIEIAKEYIRIHYPEDLYNISIKVYEDEGFSGKSFDRPDFQKFLQDEKQNPYKLLICYRLDRISRNITDFSGLINELSKFGTEFVSIKEQFDTKTPMGRAMMYIASVFSQLEREVIAERIRDNLLELSKTGVWLGGTAPFGFSTERFKKVEVIENENNILQKKRKNASKLIINEEEMLILKHIFYKFLELKSITALESYLIRNEIKTRNRVNFSTFSLKWILTNPVYVQNDIYVKEYFEEYGIKIYAENDGREKFDGKYGFLAYNKSSGKKDKPKEEWIIAVGLHPGIIPSKDWIAVQYLIEQNKTKSFSYKKTGFSKNSIVSGLLVCKCCGSKMRSKTTYIRKDGSQSYSYVCTLKEKSKGLKCNGPNVYGDKLDSEIINIIKSSFVPNSEIYQELKNMSLQDSEETNTDELNYLEKNYEQNQNEIDKLVEKVQYIDIDLMDVVNKKLRILKNNKETLEQKIDEYKKRLQTNKIHTNIKSKTSNDILKIIDNSFDIFNTFDLKTKKNILSLFVEKITGEGDKVEIYLLNDSDSNLKKSYLFLPIMQR